MLEKNWESFLVILIFSNKNGSSPKLFEIVILIGNVWAIVNKFLI